MHKGHKIRMIILILMSCVAVVCIDPRLEVCGNCPGHFLYAAPGNPVECERESNFDHSSDRTAEMCKPHGVSQKRNQILHLVLQFSLVIPRFR